MTFNIFGIQRTAYILSVVISLSVVAVFVAVLVDFVVYDRKDTVKKSRRSIVATGSMFGFYAVYYVTLYLRIGRLDYVNLPVLLMGTAMVAAGAAINILGRVTLKGNWANHIKIYEDHSFIQHGIFGVVRHPLYASLMLMLLGGSLAYRNWLSAVLTVAVFIPFMTYRARQEEMLLKEEFPQYEAYIKTTGMFFPKLWR